MSSAPILLMTQVDDAPGELLEYVLCQLTERGARNVQLLSSLSKKGRPAYVLMIDVPAEAENDVAAILAGELGVWGYRVLHSDHRHFAIVRYETLLEVHVDGRHEAFRLRLKRILNGRVFLRVKVDHDDLRDICSALAANGVTEPLAALKARIETAVGSEEPGERVVIALD
jgi:uncharacterized protein (DUF111 family)